LSITLQRHGCIRNWGRIAERGSLELQFQADSSSLLQADWRKRRLSAASPLERTSAFSLKFYFKAEHYDLNVTTQPPFCYNAPNVSSAINREKPPP
jgi:hypothetical protein